MKELKKVFEFIKKLYQNPRTRAAVILGMYAIFFIFVIALIRQVDDTPTNNTEIINNYSSVQENYEYNHTVEMKVNNDTIKYLFIGSNNNGIVNEKVKIYDYEAKKYEEISKPENINTKLIDLEKIISYVNDVKEEFSTNYKDGTIQKNFLIELSKIDSSINYKKMVEINIYEKSK